MSSTLLGWGATNFVSERDLDRLYAFLSRTGWTTRTIDGSEVFDKESFLLAARRDVLGSLPAKNWSSLEDSLRSALAELGVAHIALVWTHADRMLGGGLADLVMAIDVVKARTNHLSSHGIDLALFLVGAGDNFRSLELEISGEG